METERMALSQRERDRLRVLHEVKQKQIKQVEAARRLKITDRHVRRLLVRLGEKGDGAVIQMGLEVGQETVLKCEMTQSVRDLRESFVTCCCLRAMLRASV